ncbi:MAG: DUF2497 domain-containing protein [Acetobacteraceae bacterium]|nr:DUF2497 domain-containing protein [Acetobacteraceae bacterium]
MSGSHSHLTTGSSSHGAAQGDTPGNASGADPSMEDILASIRRILSEEETPAAASGLSPQGPEAWHRQPEEQKQDVLILDDSMLVPDEVQNPSLLHGAAASSVAPSVLPKESPAPKPAPEPDLTVALHAPKTASPNLEVPNLEVPDLPPEVLPPAKPEPVSASPPPSSLPGRMPVAPVLVPVPQSGQPPSIKASVSAIKAAAFTALPPRPSSVMPAVDPVDSPAPAEPAPAAPLLNTETASMSASVPPSTGLASPEASAAAAGSVTNLVRALTSDRNAQVHAGGPTIADLVREEMRPMVKAWLDSNLPPLVERLVRAEIERVISRTET